MPAVVVHGAGDLRIERAESRPPASGEVQVRVRFGGICGSDLHYAEHGAAGTSTIREPLILGHELAGEIARVGPGVAGFVVEQRVTIHPATSGGGYLGSAAQLPHVQGGFRELLVVGQGQIVPIPDELSLHVATLAEPLAVALHAASRLGDVEGSTVLVVGAGPIGLLALRALHVGGVGRVVVCDVASAPLELASDLGADVIQLNGSDKGSEPVEAAIECSGTVGGLHTALRFTKQGGRVVAVGLPSAMESALDMSRLVTEEIELVGAFRFDREIFDAVEVLAAHPDLDRIIAARFPVGRAAEAFAFASAPNNPGKVLLEI